MTDTAKGTLAIIGACFVWGLSGLYYKLMAHVPPLEMLSHRTLWSFVFFFLFMALRGRLGELRRLVFGRNTGLLALGALAISTNWFFFIFSVQSGQALAASLGYYIFPLVAVLLGVLVYRETLRRGHVIAVLFAALGVGVLSFGLGTFPWLAIILAGSFSAYGLVKKALDAGPVASVTGEVALLAPIALIWLIGVHTAGWSGFSGEAGGVFGTSLRDTALLMLAGLITGLPLIMFSYAAKRISYGTIGLLEYINPTLQFLVASVIFLEPVSPWHLIALPLIWVGLAIYSVVTFTQENAVSSRAASASTSST